MSRDIDFTDGVTAVTAEFLDDLQEVQTGLVVGLRVDAPSATQVRVNGDALTENAYAVRVQGKPRYGSSPQTVTVSGAAGAYTVWLTSGSGTTPKAPALAVEAGSTAPSAANVRKIGEATWSGSALTDLRVTNGVQANADQYNSFVLRPLLATSVPLRVRGLAGQTADVLRVENSAGTAVAAVSTSGLSVTGTVSVTGAAAIGGNLAVGTAGTPSSLTMVNGAGALVTLTVNASNQLVIT
jgi:hypothetical protein